LKGLPPHADAEIEEPPTWLALHEFTDALDKEALLATGETEWSKKIVSNAKRCKSRCTALSRVLEMGNSSIESPGFRGYSRLETTTRFL
jgi:hypothetical protein